ncbi:MAG: helix-turn-helix domain-containing protein [Gracilimonas sp.]|uniref:helix-turn-helix domain-containing protein n=1 Tax=Gracilimonas sp. TaxID=1974203 RepID=UPI003751B8FE|nr:helix-turn-helix domain-containing protein [Gracilimonas sp.]
MRIDKIYQKLKEQYSEDEIAESYMIPETGTVKEDETQYAISKYREERLNQMSDHEKVVSKIISLKFQIVEHVKEQSFSFHKTFGSFLLEYIKALGRSRKEISKELDLHYTKLSRIINDREEPSIELCYRLEKHSGELINVLNWWQLIKKKEEFILS